VLFLWSRRFTISHFDIDEWNNFSLQAILWSFDNYDEFLTHLGSNLECNLLLKLFGDGVLNEPAVEFYLWVLDERAVLVIEWQFFTIVLAENSVTIKLLQPRNLHVYYLFLAAYICQK